MDVRIKYFFLTQASMIFIQENAAFIQFWFLRTGTINSTCGTLAHTLILPKPLTFIGKTLKKYIKNSLKYRTLMKTHFNYVFIQIQQPISDVCAYVVLWTLTHCCFFSENVNFQNLNDVIAAAQLKTNGTSF